MRQNMQPEKVYVGFLKLGVLISALLGLIASIILIYFAKSQGLEVSWAFAATLPLMILIGSYLKYQMQMKVEGFGGKTITSNNQIHIKQFTYVLFPFVMLLALGMYEYFIQRYTLIGYLVIVGAILISELLFFVRLKNLEKTEGKDTRPIMSFGEMILLFLAVLVIGSLIIFSMVAS